MIIFNKNNIKVFQSAFFKMNSVVVVTEDIVLLVDPGYHPSEINEIRQFVDSVKQNRPIFLFFTHSDFDHIVGYGAFPDAKTIASRPFVESSLKKKQINDIINFDDEMYINRDYKVEFPSIDQIIIVDGQELKIGDTLITFFYAFGHTDDGLFAYLENKKLLLAGDYLSDLEFPFVNHSFQEYKKTLEAFRRVTENRSNLLLIPGHGTPTDDRIEIQQRIKTSEEYFCLIKKEQNENSIESFLVEKGYTYKTNLVKRHQENIKHWNSIDK